MVDDNDDHSDGESEGSIQEMMSNLDDAKKLEDADTRRSRRQRSGSALKDVIQRRTDAAVLASNHEARLKEIESNDMVTHRSSKAWTSAKAGFDAHGRLPIYYRLNGDITHKGYITEMVLHPNENTDEAKQLLKHITDDDTYSDFNDKLDTTTFIVTGGERLDDPFPQSELQKLSGDGTIAANYSRQPAYVVQRPEDFSEL